MGLKRPILFLSGGLLWLAAVSGHTAVWDAGTSHPFEMGAGSRALGMGSAYVAAADDVNALFWNPAGLARADRWEVAAMHAGLFYDTPYDFLGFTAPILDVGTFAAGAVRVATGGIVLRDAGSFLLPGGEGEYDLRQYLLGYGRELIGSLRIGGVIKFDQQLMLGDSAVGTGFDAGVMYHLPGAAFAEATGWKFLDWDELHLGVSFQNILASRLRLRQEADLTALLVRTGLSYRWRFGTAPLSWLLASVELDKSTWRAWRFSAGAELDYQELAALRAGWHDDAWTAGAGIAYAGVTFDYAIWGQELGLTHRFSLTYRFGTPLSRQSEERERRRQEEMDREAERRATTAVSAAKDDMEKALKDSERRFKRERESLLARQQRLIRQERDRQQALRNQEVEREYFKSLHYFNGIRDFLAKEYKRAVTEFETVAKVDPNYLDLPYYLGRARQMASGLTSTMNEQELALYYQGIDLYMENKFAEAIAVWQQILKTQPANVLVLRNIEESQGRLVTQQGQTAPAANGAAPKL